MSNYFQPIIEQLSQRSAEATLSILGITDPDLRHFLSEEFTIRAYCTIAILPLTIHTASVNETPLE